MTERKLGNYAKKKYGMVLQIPNLNAVISNENEKFKRRVAELEEQGKSEKENLEQVKTQKAATDSDLKEANRNVEKIVRIGMYKCPKLAFCKIVQN